MLPRFLEDHGYTYPLRFSSNAVTKRIDLKDRE
jgi:hypothetical protein